MYCLSRNFIHIKFEQLNLWTGVVHLKRTKKFDTVNRQARILGKLMLDTKQKRKNWFKISENVNNSFEDVIPTPKNIQKDTGTSRRVVVLNKLFMKHITDIMATGKYSDQLVGHGIQISKVKVARNFNIVNVFWSAKGSENDESIENVLKKAGGSLRQELCNLRVMGMVPEIRFVKDRTYERYEDVERLLKVADFGEDHVPSDPSEILKTEFTMETELPLHLKEEILMLDDQDDEPLPPMRHDVFGVNQTEIMNRIKALTEKSKALHRCTSTSDHLVPETKVNLESSFNEYNKAPHFDKEKFAQFLRKRYYEKKKMLRTRDDFKTEDTFQNNNPYDEGVNPVFFQEEEDYIDEDNEK